MQHNPVVFAIFLIFCGAAVFSTLALYTRQSLLIAYMLLGVLFGPWGLKAISDVTLVQKTGDIGIIFLLFLLGLHLHPQNLIRMLGKTIWVTLASSVLFFALGYAVGYLLGYNYSENAIIGIAIMFSSTIIGLKLLPTTIEQHQHTNEIMVSILLLQDLIAIAALIFIQSAAIGTPSFSKIALMTLSLPLLFVLVFFVERFILTRVFTRFERVREYMFLVSIAWCLGISELAYLMGLSYEIGAFIAGIAVAASPIALYIAENLKPLRDFFLVLFFFSIGASFDLHYFPKIIIPALLLTILIMLFKPIIFQLLLRQVKETKPIAWEVGIRLGQISEFSLLVVYLADRSDLIGNSAAFLIQAVTMLLFITSSFWVVKKYPTPLLVSSHPHAKAKPGTDSSQT